MPHDALIETIATYVCNEKIESENAYQTALLCLADSLGCASLALQFPACRHLLGPLVPGTQVPGGSRVPGTAYVLDPVTAAFNTGLLIRWLDFNDTWLAAEWGHPSDNLGGILSIGDYLSQKKPFSMKNLLTCLIKSYEIQGCLALENSFNKEGLDHVILVKVATAAVTAFMLGGSYLQVCDAISQAWVDGGPLRTYRHAPNVGSRKSWAAGDATARGLWLAMMTLRGEKGYSEILNASRWGFHDVVFKGKPFILNRKLGSYVMENILFKVHYPAEFHAQTALEVAIQLHPEVRGKWDQIAKIEIETHEAALRIIDKKGPLHNPADRDHCLQYIVAIGFLKGTLTAEDYEDSVAQNPLIDTLRSKMILRENTTFSRDYLDPEKRSIANSMTIFFNDGTQTSKVTVEYPLGHQKRRQEALPRIWAKCADHLHAQFSPAQAQRILSVLKEEKVLLDMSVSDFLNFLVHI
jgi:2-methylcitrate dehydratase